MAVYYDLNTTGAMTPIGSAMTVPSSWFSNNVSAARNTPLAGIMVSHGAVAQMAFVYDFFRIDRAVP